MSESSRANDDGQAAKPKVLDVVGGGAFGVGLVLVLLPAVALFAGISLLNENKLVGLPILAIFGIVVLLGTLALVAMLFQRLGLAQKSEPLGLPPGSMRAAISLSLIVLFAIISIMLYLSISEKSEAFRVRGLTESERNALVGNAPTRIVNIDEGDCAASVPAGGQCATSDRRFDVHMRATPAPEATDLAKQLLILIGTLMTSVTSFYFATRGSAAEEVPDKGSRGGQPGGSGEGEQGTDRARDGGDGGPSSGGAPGAATLSGGAATLGTADVAARPSPPEVAAETSHAPTPAQAPTHDAKFETAPAVSGSEAAAVAPPPLALDRVSAGTTTQSSPSGSDDRHPGEDGCGIEVVEPTADEDLPAARGGVAKEA